MASSASELQDALYGVSLRLRSIRGLALIDSNGLPLVSTVTSERLEEALAAFGIAISASAARASGDFQLGPVHHVHVTARDRQVVVLPITDGASLVAIADPDLAPVVLDTQLLALVAEVRSILQDHERSLHDELTEV